MASNESIVVLKREALAFLASERERIMRLSREEAINEVLQWANLENKIQVVESVTDNIILEVT